MTKQTEQQIEKIIQAVWNKKGKPLTFEEKIVDILTTNFYEDEYGDGFYDYDEASKQIMELLNKEIEKAIDCGDCLELHKKCPCQNIKKIHSGGHCYRCERDIPPQRATLNGGKK